MLRIWIHRIRPDKEQRLRAWLAELNARADEVRASLAIAHVRAEQACIVPGAGGLTLVYVSDAADHEVADRTFAASARPIDLEHASVMNECVEETLDAVPLYSVAVP